MDRRLPPMGARGIAVAARVAPAAFVNVAITRPQLLREMRLSGEPKWARMRRRLVRNCFS
jgi:hypothetical protein